MVGAIGTKEYIQNREDMYRKMINIVGKKEKTSKKNNKQQEEKPNDENNVEKMEILEKNNEFHYIQNDALNQVFSFCSNKTNSFTCHLCIFSIRQHKYLPFVTFLMEKQPSNVYSFPFFNFQCPEIEDVDVYFKNECVKKALKLLQLYEQINENTVNDIYKGFVTDETNANIFVVFDITKYSFDIKKEGKNVFAILDELMNKKKIRNISVSPIVDMFFQSYQGSPRFNYLYDGNNNEIQNPEIAYNCLWNEHDNVYENIFKDELNVKENNVLCSKDICAIQDDEYGTNYFFGSLPITQNNIQNIVRYAVYKDSSIEENYTTGGKQEIWYVSDAYRIAKI